MPEIDPAGRSRYLYRLFHNALASSAPPTPLREIELPNIASAKKNMRKSRAAMARNRAQRSALRTALKKGHAPDVDAAERLAAVSLLDRAARKGLIHPNAAARHKSRMAKKASKK